MSKPKAKVVLIVRNPKTGKPAIHQECKDSDQAKRFKDVFKKNGWVIEDELVLA